MTKRLKKSVDHIYDPHVTLERFRGLVSEATFACVASNLGQPVPKALRINRIKDFKKEDLERWKKSYDWEIKPVPFCPSGWQVPRAGTGLSQTREHLMGAYYIQDASSMLPPELFGYASSPGELVLDMAASPGGKTTHLIDKLGDTGLVIANDGSRSRIPALRVALDRWGSINSAVTCHPGELFGFWFPSVFDKVLLDAPCSMEGLRTSESHPIRPIMPGERKELANRQTRLLTAALRAVKPGGQVVYSTCTLAPEEDENVLLSLRRRYGHSIEVLPVAVPVHAPPLDNHELNQFPDIQNALRIWPHLYDTAGFFVALIGKNDHLDESSERNVPSRPWESQGWQRVNPREMDWIRNQLADRYGFDLDEIMRSQAVVFWKFGKRLVAIPELYLHRFRDFPAISCGLELGIRIEDHLMISHEWASRFGHRFTTGRITIPSEKIDDWVRGQDLVENLPGTLERGSLVCCYQPDGLFLGRGKVISGKVKNLLPRRLVG